VNIGGVEPTSETIASFDYPIARPLYFYVKNAHRGVIPPRSLAGTCSTG
jgi:phosphate transport system substrate-binding protein